MIARHLSCHSFRLRLSYVKNNKQFRSILENIITVNLMKYHNVTPGVRGVNASQFQISTVHFVQDKRRYKKPSLPVLLRVYKSLDVYTGAVRKQVL